MALWIKVVFQQDVMYRSVFSCTSADAGEVSMTILSFWKAIDFSLTETSKFLSW